jgi:uncharacterized membrane protein YphA (DoxX/SURF4 family)
MWWFLIVLFLRSASKMSYRQLEVREALIGEPVSRFVETLRALAIPAPAVLSWLIGLLEVTGGLALLAGIWFVVFSPLLIAEMFVALTRVHWQAGFNFIHIIGQSEAGPVYGLPGYEVDLLYIAGLVSLLLSGPGNWSLGGRRTTVEPHETSEDSQTVIRAEPEGAPLNVERSAVHSDARHR